MVKLDNQMSAFEKRMDDRMEKQDRILDELRAARRNGVA